LQDFTPMFTTKTKECVFANSLQQNKGCKNRVLAYTTIPTQ